MSTCRLGALETGPPKPKPVKVPKPKEDKSKQTSSKQPENVCHFFVKKNLAVLHMSPHTLFQITNRLQNVEEKTSEKVGKIYNILTALCDDGNGESKLHAAVQYLISEKD